MTRGSDRSAPGSSLAPAFLIAWWAFYILAGCHYAAKVDKARVAQVSTIRVAKTTFPDSLTVRDTSGLVLGVLVGGLIGGVVGAVIDSHGSSVPSDVASRFGQETDDLIRARLKNAGYNVVDNDQPADAVLQVAFLEFGYSSNGRVYEPQITVEVTLKDRTGAVVYEDFLAIGNNLYALRMTGPRVVGQGQLTFSEKDEVSANVPAVVSELSKVLPVLINALAIPPRGTLPAS